MDVGIGLPVAVPGADLTVVPACSLPGSADPSQVERLAEVAR
jgi:hypothetical protein